MITRTLVSLALAACSSEAASSNIHNKLPSEIDINTAYVFYSHGFIVEGSDPTPVETKHGWGKYDFPAIKQALSDPNYQLIATHREKDTDPRKYAYELSSQVRQLVKAGVNPNNITLVGFSRGAFITGIASDKLSDLAVNIVLLAGCGNLISKYHTDIKVYGKVLSVYEHSDNFGQSCAALKDKSASLVSFEEIKINTGLSHGAFYHPRKEWINPVKQWIKKQNKGK
ncbi:alpha/beta hydrolase [Pseudoalteromonas sp. T1lg65]|uniref:alpha/beta hydrolase n=1 Tax=Pseudoalteromonas sp. T1lg65 TaxID=2077101 RepID=UPI003F7B077A